MQVQVQNTAGVTGLDPEKQRVAKLKDGAQQFEAMLMQQMLKTAKFGAAPGDSDDDAGESGGIVGSYGTEALAKGMANAGGLGLAKQIVRQVMAEDQAKGAGISYVAGEGSKVL